ncbi:MAG: class I tRNA ligase family protein, partial [Nanoarchaeota archaeon]
MENHKFNFSQIEKKWQEKWEKEKVFEVKESKSKKKYYVLEMYPYPSASFLHVGHVRNYTIGDVYARFRRMNGFNVLYPMGYDSFGLPAETAAKKEGIHPKKYAETSIKKIRAYQKALGNSYDWSRIIASHDPEYYKWNQYFFLKLYEKGLAYRKKAPVNFCENCESVLANEESEGGKCWRCGNEVIQKDLEQWFFKITDYADKLLKDLNKIEWPERIKIMQKNWIGKSHGTNIEFKINDEKWLVFTTRPDTIYGVTFMVISAQHPRLMELVSEAQKKDVEKFLKKIKSTSEKDLEELDKEGVFTGSFAINPVTNEKIPVWAGNFVLADYGSGMVMAVPAHDQRDFEFAKKYGIEIKQVIASFFETTSGPDAVKKDKKTIKRDAVFGIVKHWKENKYLCLNWEKFNWKSFVIGGVEKDETPKEAIKREVIEETGYSDIKSIKQIGFESHANFFARHKDVNRYGRFKAFLVELKSDKYKKPEEEHTKNHNPEWIEYNKVVDYINLENNKYFWNILTNGERAYTGQGKLINSKEFSGVDSEKAKQEITKYLEKQEKARKTINFKLRDWLISRQRYWGTPIPIIHCNKCGIVPVPEKDLPVILPKDVKFGKGNPLLTNEKWINIKCPKCNSKAKRETDTMDTFVNSSWYFLRYTDPNNNKKIFDSKKANYWCPIDQYIGGAEHACMHLIYFRYYTKFLADLGLINFREPAKKLFHQGMLSSGGGVKMSKSKGNVINPDAVSEKYGIDTARYFLLSLASPDKPRDWSESGIQGSLRFINKIFRIYKKPKIGKDSEEIEILINKTIKEISEEYETFDYRTATIKLKELFENLEKQEQISKQTLENSLKILNPICPHITEYLWEQLGNKSLISL